MRRKHHRILILRASLLIGVVQLTGCIPNLCQPPLHAAMDAERLENKLTKAFPLGATDDEVLASANRLQLRQVHVDWPAGDVCPVTACGPQDANKSSAVSVAVSATPATPSMTDIRRRDYLVPGPKPPVAMLVPLIYDTSSCYFSTWSCTRQGLLAIRLYSRAGTPDEPVFQRTIEDQPTP